MNKLEELDALVNAATPGPWSARIGGNYADDVWVASDAERPWEGHMALKLWSRTMGRGDYAIGSPEHKAACANAALIVWLVNNAPAMLKAQAEEIARKDAALKEIARQDFGGLQGIAEDHRFDAEDYDKETALAKLQAWHDEENVYLMGRIAHRRSVARAALGSPPDA